MSRSLNKCMLLGHVGQEPEVRTTQGGVKVAKFSLATNNKFKDKERTDWHRCTVFGKLADVVEEYVHKGDRIYVEGRIEYSTSEKDGRTLYFTDIIVSELLMLGSSKGAQDRPAASKGYGSTPLTEPDDDLPF